SSCKGCWQQRCFCCRRSVCILDPFFLCEGAQAAARGAGVRALFGGSAVKYWIGILGFVFSFAFLVCDAVVQAQDATGRIIGNVSDPSGAAIPEVKVTVTNDKTLITEVTTTSNEGFYQVLSLPIGSYTVTVEKAGFRRQVFD